MKSSIYLDILMSKKFSNSGVEKGMNAGILDVNEQESIHDHPVLPFYHLIDNASDISKKIEYIKDKQRYLAITVLTSEEIEKYNSSLPKRKENEREEDYRSNSPTNGLVFLSPITSRINLEYNRINNFFRISNINNLEAKEMNKFIKDDLHMTPNEAVVLHEEDEYYAKPFMEDFCLKFFEQESPPLLKIGDNTIIGNVIRYKAQNGKFEFIGRNGNLSEEDLEKIFMDKEIVIIFGSQKWELVFKIQRIVELLKVKKHRVEDINILTSASFEDHKIPKQRRKQAGTVYYTFFPIGEDFSKKFESAYGYKPSIEEAAGYDIIRIACEAIARGGMESELIARYLKKNSFNYSLGLLYFTDIGEAIRPYNFDKGNPPPIMKILEEGDFIEYKKQGGEE